MSRRNINNQLPPFNASKYRVGIVVAQFNARITEKMLEAALSEAQKFKIPTKNIRVERVAGSVELPYVLNVMADSEKFDALVALGVIIRGETDHYDYVAKFATEGILEVMLDDAGVPIGFGVLTCENQRQAEKRISMGADALSAALHNARIARNY